MTSRFELHGWCLNGNCGKLLYLDDEKWKCCPKHGRDCGEKPVKDKIGRYSGKSKTPWGGYEER